MFKVKFGGDFGHTEIIVADKKSLDALIKELNSKYNKNRVTVTFEVEELN